MSQVSQHYGGRAFQALEFHLAQMPLSHGYGQQALQMFSRRASTLQIEVTVWSKHQLRWSVKKYGFVLRTKVFKPIWKVVFGISNG